MRKLLAHGTINPSYLTTIVEQYPGVDSAALFANMREHGLNPRQVLRLFLNSPFHPRDILAALATKVSPAVLYGLVRDGHSLDGYMLRSGYRPVDRTQTAEEPLLMLNPADIRTRPAARQVSGAFVAHDWRSRSPLEQNCLNAASVRAVWQHRCRGRAFEHRMRSTNRGWFTSFPQWSGSCSEV